MKRLLLLSTVLSVAACVSPRPQPREEVSPRNRASECLRRNAATVSASEPSLETAAAAVLALCDTALAAEEQDLKTRSPNEVPALRQGRRQYARTLILQAKEGRP